MVRGTKEDSRHIAPPQWHTLFRVKEITMSVLTVLVVVLVVVLIVNVIGGVRK